MMVLDHIYYLYYLYFKESTYTISNLYTFY